MNDTADFNEEYEEEFNGEELVLEKRTIPPFHGVSMSGIGTLYITQTDSCGLAIEARADTLPGVRTRVENGILKVRYKAPNIFTNPGRINVYASMIEVRSLSLSGTTKAIGRTGIISAELKIGVSGATSFDLEVKTEKLKTSLSGSSNGHLYGAALEHDLRLSGAAKVSGFELGTKDTKIQSSGAAIIEVFVDHHLRCKLSGAAKVRLRGDPEISQLKTSGVARLERVD
ncbi:MAG: DUF2807 domain-containing protein [Deltaproteobacteria bacterium]|nr:DUF2807 domain-containing protein [Deltaproteobacteria bacterium]